jgi:hypothetical protein
MVAEKEKKKVQKEFQKYLARGREMTTSVAARISATNARKFG